MREAQAKTRGQATVSKASVAAPPSKPPRRTGGKATTVAAKAGPRRIAKADGDAPVQGYIASMPGWQRDLGQRLDALIVRAVPQVRRAVKWNSPMYGIAGQGWFLGFHSYTHHVNVSFFRGASLRPVPPGGTGEGARYIKIHEGELDEARMEAWVKQAAALPGIWPTT